MYSLASFGTDGLLSLFLSEAKHIDSEMIGWFGTCRGIGALLGAVVYARLGFSMLRKQQVALLFLGVGCLSPLWISQPLVLGLFWGMCWGFQETAFVTLAMRYAEGAWAATFFAISMIFSNVGTSLGEASAAPLVPSLGYQGVFILYAVIAWASLFLVPRMIRKI